jgi:hypothetical protein
MNHDQLGEVVAERELEFVASDGSRQSVRVLLGKPIQEENGPWFCPFVIQANSFQRQFRAAGEDSMQSMLLAQKVIAIELEVLARDNKGSFTWFGDANLGFA